MLSLVLTSCSGGLDDVGKMRGFATGGGGEDSPPAGPGTEAGYSLSVIDGNFQIATTARPLSKQFTIQLKKGEIPVSGGEIIFNPDLFDGGHFLETGPVVTGPDGEASSPLYLTGDLPRKIIIEVTASVSEKIVATAYVYAETRVATLTFTGFRGCLSGRALDTNRIEVLFERPEASSAVVVKRNGATVYRSRGSEAESDSFIDSGLEEGVEYIYSCHAVHNNVESDGSDTLRVTTILSNVPVFAGVERVELGSRPNELSVIWSSPTDGPLAYSYQIFLGTVADELFLAEPKATESSGRFSYKFTGMGDGLLYFVGVRACNFLGRCEQNTVIKEVALPDTGPPQSLPPEGSYVEDSQLFLKLPWNYRVGDVLKRHIYYKKLQNGSSDTGSFQLIYSAIYPQLGDVAQTVALSNIEEGTKLLFFVIEEDRQGNLAKPSPVIEVPPLDLTAPQFLGVTGLKRGEDRETEILVEFIAIDSEDANTDGAASYFVYVRKAAMTAATALAGVNPCLSGDKTHTIAASGFVSGQAASFKILGLTPRTIYQVCVKAVDTAGNKSATTGFGEIITGDAHAPVFAGLQSLSIDNATGSILANWQPSPSVDIKDYKIFLWKNSLPPLNPVVLRVDGGQKKSATITRSDFSYTDGDYIYAQVSACDDSDLIPGLSANCTDYLAFTPKSLQVPDTAPPPGFEGIAAQGLQQSLVEGQVTVRWLLPAKAIMGDHYRGFKIYQIDEAANLTMIKNIDCVDESLKLGLLSAAQNRDCHSLQLINSATIVNQIPGRILKLHVRAYDAIGNETVDLSPQLSFAFVKVKDETPPLLSRDFKLENGFFSWGAASDNQDPKDNGISYQLYRKYNEAFTDFSNPGLNSLVVAQVSDLEAVDGLTLAEGSIYHYMLCAKDSSGNQGCLNKNLSRVVLDAVPPQINSPAVQSITKHAWSFSWQLYDAGGISRVEIYRKISSAVNTAWEKKDGILVKSFGEGEALTGSGRLSAPQLSTGVANYLVQVYDRFGNSVIWRPSVVIDQNAAVTSISSSSGPVAGGNSIIIETSGFDSSLEAFVDNRPCLSLTLIKANTFACIVSPSEGGRLEVTMDIKEYLSEFDGFIRSSVIYKYVNGEGCLGPATGQYFHNDNQATGASSSPYLICNAQEFSNIRFAARNKYFSLGANIDFSNTSGYVSVPETSLSVEGNNFSVYGLRLINQPGLFLKVVSDDSFTSRFANLKLYGVISPVTELNGPLASDFSGVLENLAFKTVFAASQSVSTPELPLFCGGLVGSLRSGSIVRNIGGDISTSGGSLSCNLGGVTGHSGRNSLLSSSPNRFFVYFKNIKLTLNVAPAATLFGGVVGVVRPILYTPAPILVSQANGCSGCSPAPSALDDFRRGQISFEAIEISGKVSGGTRIGGVVGEITGAPSNVIISAVKSTLVIEACDATGGGTSGLIGYTGRGSLLSYNSPGKGYHDGVVFASIAEMLSLRLSDYAIYGSVDTKAQCPGDRFKLVYGGTIGGNYQAGAITISHAFNATKTPGIGYSMRYYYNAAISNNTLVTRDDVRITGWMDNQVQSQLPFIDTALSQDLSKDVAPPELFFWQNLNFDITNNEPDINNYRWFYSPGFYPEPRLFSVPPVMP